MAAADSDQVRCDKCEKDLDSSLCTWVNRSICKKAETLGRTRLKIWRCNDCSSLVGRVFRIRDSDPHAYESFLQIPQESRADFFLHAKNKFDDDLKKAIDESYSEHTTEYNHFSAMMKAPAMSVAEAKDLPRFKHYPEGLQRLLDNPKMSYECPLTGIPMVRVPESTLHEESGRKIHNEESRSASACSSLKAIKAPKDAVAKAAAKAAGKAKAKALPKPLMAKAQKSLTDTLANMKLWQETLLIASSDVSKEFVTPAVTERVTKHFKQVQQVHGELSQMIRNKKPEDRQKISEDLDWLGKANDQMASEIGSLEGSLARRKIASKCNP